MRLHDYAFGQRLLDLRKKAGLTQQELADALHVRRKAVSKWETWAAKPTTNTLRKLSALYAISIEQLLRWKEPSAMPVITKIVITGGPCAGKTTALSWIQNAFTQEGYRVLFVPETATELIGGGVAPWTCGSNVDYQKCQVKLQLEKEAIFHQAAGTMSCDKILIVCDRGAMDNRAYMTELEFQEVLRAVEKTEVELRDSYDAVFHLTTAAKGALSAYTLANNAARTETPEEATALDDKLLSAWTGHPHLRVIDNSTDFQEKLKRLIGEISSFLGEPEPLEIERKFLIEYPDLAWLENHPSCQRIEIIQTYLQAPEGQEVRVRQRGIDGSFVYYKTTKKPLDGAKRVEIEERLTQNEYLSLLMKADVTRRQIRKTRYCLLEDSQYFEIDVYPFWDDKAILEIELADEDTPIRFPREITILKEVTDDPSFKNAALAKL